MPRNDDEMDSDSTHGSDDPDDEGEAGEPEVVEVPLSDSLDLHTFAPRDVKELVQDYIDLCVERGFEEVRIIHGKGVGALRRIVHAVLERHARVASFTLAAPERGGWGATIVRLKPADDGEA